MRSSSSSASFNALSLFSPKHHVGLASLMFASSLRMPISGLASRKSSISSVTSSSVGVSVDKFRRSSLQWATHSLGLSWWLLKNEQDFRCLLAFSRTTQSSALQFRREIAPTSAGSRSPVHSCTWSWARASCSYKTKPRGKKPSLQESHRQPEQAIDREASNSGSVEHI
jgi:hypothetical protein